MWASATGGNFALKAAAGTRALNAADLAATVLFAIEGGTRASAAGLDLFGIIALALIVANGGGIIRDALLGDLPPHALRTPTPMYAALAGALFVVMGHSIFGPVPAGALWAVDALGLGLFAATGAQKALGQSCNAVTVVILAAITGTGGGIIGDVLLNRTPAVLTQDIYATAAATAGCLYLVCARFGLKPGTSLLLAAMGAFLLRSGSVLLGWQLPHLN
ncbi:TRIC cation channel family protein [Paenarthrobacter nicotinovorans]|uniref:TRIC cation channel family protein n=1 Tax=Paenarthrobacter nicotinovorans TaxID=29320 RepID=A0ABV0GLZ4_PAENI